MIQKIKKFIKDKVGNRDKITLKFSVKFDLRKVIDKIKDKIEEAKDGDNN